MTTGNLNLMLLDRFERHARLPALAFREGGKYRTLSYAELGARCATVAKGLRASGLLRGERIAILSRNRPEWVSADIGAILAGSIVSALYPSSSSAEIIEAVNHLEASWLFVENSDQLAKIRDHLADMPSVRAVYVFDAAETDSPGAPVRPFSDLQESPADADAYRELRDLAHTVHADDPLAINFTSGTTGAPKGVVLTHGNYLKTMECVLQHLGELADVRRIFSFLSLAHAYERLGSYYMALYTGKCVALARNSAAFLAHFRAVKPQAAQAVPRVFEKIYCRMMNSLQDAPEYRRLLFNWGVDTGHQVRQHRHAGKRVPMLLWLRYQLADFVVLRKIRSAFGGELKFIVCGGSRLNRKIAEFFDALGVVILQGWGGAEATALAALNKPSEYRLGKVGKVLPGMIVRVAPDGELQIRGPNVFRSYWRDRDSTNGCFTADGFYRTGDLGTVDSDGWVSVTDHKQAVIVTARGDRVPPAKVQTLLCQGRFIDMAYIHGDGRDYITALLVLDPSVVELAARRLEIGHQPWQEQVHHHSIAAQVRDEVDEANAQLHKTMQVKSFRILSRPFAIERGEMTHTLKLRKSVIERHYRDLLDSMYARTLIAAEA